MKIKIIGNINNYANWINNAEIVKLPEEADLVIFTGGEDVDPSLYNEPRHPRTSSNITRDIREKDIYEYCLDKKIPMLGICRGLR